MKALRVLPATLALTLVAAVAACGPSASSEAAQAAYDECSKGEKTLVRLSGSAVEVVVDGDDARAYAGVDTEIDRMGDGDADALGDGMSVLLAIWAGTQCLVDETGYPGSWDQLKSGESWDGWRYEEVKGAGSATTFRFVSTG